ncbi:hypothetical protein PTTG_29157 [Puccinia triticina 1-1 BBBD Race 1]|uniref:ANK_REP_REGION domain-containing protein n=1 Tax=Puccinia triticina (isolate 1-1 / race 1 (BBBD)) TaxID=630390 RepID=A0A180G5W7_PUCT1|nr:hypothetical protein PTTG_29157 [Puccinia triticina 1-1 BBBD Race 1]
MEYLLKSIPTFEHRKKTQEEEEGVERDEYGLELNRPPSTEAKNPKAKPSTALKFGSSAVSKPLPPASLHGLSQQQLQSDQADPLLRPRILLLHDLILDHPNSELELFLSQSANDHPDPQEFSRIINGYLNGYTAFHQACDAGDLKKVQMLCGAGVDRGLKDETDGLTGIELAQEAGRTEVVGFLASLP